MSDSPIISIVIPAYNGRDVLALTLDSIAQADFDMSAIEVIVVDDGSTDGTYEAFAGKQYPYGFTILKTTNQGQSAATNAAIRQARGEYIFSSAQDIIFHRDLFNEHLAWHQQQPGEDIVVLGSLPYAPGLKISPFMYYLVTGGWQFGYFLIKDVSGVPPQFLYAPNFSLKKTVFERVGLFDEDFRFGYQDTELGIRLANSGVRIEYNAKAIGYHNDVKELRSFCNRQEVIGASLVALIEKQPGYEALHHLFDRILSYGLSFSPVYLDHLWQTVEEAEKDLLGRSRGYEAAWEKAYVQKIPVSELDRGEQELVVLCKRLFAAFENLMWHHWAKGLLLKYIEVHGAGETARLIKGRYIRKQMSLQQRDIINTNLHKYSLDIGAVASSKCLISLIIHGIDSYRQCFERLHDFIIPGGDIYNFQLVLVLPEGIATDDQISKLQSVAEVVVADTINRGIARAMGKCRAEIACVVSMSTQIDYEITKKLSGLVFNKVAEVGILGGSMPLADGRKLRIGYEINRSGQYIPLVEKKFNPQGMKPVPVANPEYFVMRKRAFDTIDATGKLHDDAGDVWNARLCEIAAEVGIGVYHLPKLVAHSSVA